MKRDEIKKLEAELGLKWREAPSGAVSGEEEERLAAEERFTRASNAKLIRDVREQLDLSADGFARLMGVSDGRVVRKWESNASPISGPALVLAEAMYMMPALREKLLAMEVTRGHWRVKLVRVKPDSNAAAGAPQAPDSKGEDDMPDD